MNPIESEPRTYNGRYQLLSSKPDSASQRALDLVSNSTVVLEKLRAQPLSQSDLSRTLDKVQILTVIGHSSLVNIRDVVSDSAGTFLVTETVEGRTLLELISANRPPALSDLMRWSDELLDVVGFLHTRKEPILHNDIQPENIWINESSVLKLKYPAVWSDATGEDGNEAYRSLEFLWGGLDMGSRIVISRLFEGASASLLKSPPDERSDIYSVSAVLYFAITCTVPPDVISRAAELAATGCDPLLAPLAVNPNVSEAVSDVIIKGMAIRREDRYRSVSEMRAALNNTLSGLYDDLTGFPNRIQFTNHVSSAIKEFEANDCGPFGVVLFEVNGMKDILSRLGKPAVDQVQLTVAGILKASLRTNDVISLLAPDRFGLLLYGASNPNDLLRVADRIQASLGDSFSINGIEEPISTTAGIVISGARERDPDVFFVEALAAIASAKQLGTSRCMIYDSNS